ncbi:MAG: SDR family NAD(P)-dependent oxidoreductase [Phormidesmis sp.]
MNLKGKTVVLTGASRGIGREISQRFAKQGANLIGIARSAPGLDRWKTDMTNLGIEARIVVFDLSQTEKLPELAQAIEQKIKSLDSLQVDVLINNAAVEIYRAFQDYRLEEIKTIINVNLLSVMTLTHCLLPQLAPQGCIVNMASLAGKKSHPYDSAYAASKAGLLMWSHSLRQEMAGSQQTVSVVCPGYVADSGMLVNTGIKSPWLAGRSQSSAVAEAVLKAVQTRQAEIIVNRDPITAAITRIFLSIEQLLPHFGDLSNRLLGITRLNQQRVQSPPVSSHLIAQPVTCDSIASKS